MKIANKQLINLPVITESGHELGTVLNFNIDIDSQSILEYEIQPNSIVKKLLEGELIISRGQVVNITQDKLIVKDTFSRQKNYQKLRQALEHKKSVPINKEQ